MMGPVVRLLALAAVFSTLCGVSMGIHPASLGRPGSGTLSGSLRAHPRPIPTIRGDENDYCPPNLECAPYKLLNKSEDGVEVREYPPTVWVATQIDTGYYNAQARGFRRLYKYIGGENEMGTKIEMTAPVSVTIPAKDGFEGTRDGPYTMAFVLPAEFQDNPPAPLNDDLYIDRRDGFVASVVGFGGWAWKGKTYEQARSLYALLMSQGIEAEMDEFQSLGFNPPFQLRHRHNEVLVKWEGSFERYLNRAQDGECKPWSDKAACEQAGCAWCEAKAVPSACYPPDMAKKLPPSVFSCDIQFAA
ncbi:unnamed protein product [Pedinophyceae sp. YPF-701]|nr:unnamed protein product [Pedinophyceae sp. YPF-701]